MTFEEAMAHSIKLELEAWEGLALDLPDAEERRHRFIDFNPYMYLPEMLSYQPQTMKDRHNG